jgi:hypothetical protein
MSPDQLFILEVLKLVVPPIAAYVIGWHLPQPSWMKKQPPQKEEG